MTLSVQKQASLWGVAALLFFVVLWFLGDVIMPFVLGGAIAYFLDPVADRLERMGLSRVMATVVITVVAILVFLVFLLAVVPLLIDQTTQLVQALPDYYNKFRALIESRFPSLLQSGTVSHETLQTFGDTLREHGGEVLQGLLNSAASVVNMLVMVVIAPVVAFYLLLDWDHMVAQIDALLPRDHAPTIRKLASDINHTLASFVRGMGSVCLILGSYYAVALMLVGLQFGLVVGLIAGLVTFIPYLGAIIGGSLAIGLALFQFWGDWPSIAMVAGVFFIGQIAEGNFLTPKLVGKSVGLHPVWLIFALSVFGALFGFVGMLVAVPVAASIGVVARFFVSGYKGSKLFIGLSGAQDAEKDDA